PTSSVIRTRSRVCSIVTSQVCRFFSAARCSALSASRAYFLAAPRWLNVGGRGSNPPRLESCKGKTTMHLFQGRISMKCASLAGLLLLAALPLHADPKNPADVVLEMKGYLVPAQQVTVAPQVAGPVVDLLIEEGQRVKKGDILARLDPGEYEAKLQLAKAE